MSRWIHFQRLAASMLRPPARSAFLPLLALIVAVSILLPVTRALNFKTPLPAVTLGAIVGLTYGVLSVGLVLIYRTNQIINFAHGQIGAFGSAFFALIVLRFHFPYWVAFPIALAIAALTGVAAETGVVRRLRNAPRLMSIVATLGVGQFLVLLAASINTEAPSGAVFPQPPFLPLFTLGELRITPAHSGMMLLSPVAVAGIALFLRYSRYGLAIRSAAANPDAARMAGIYAGRMSSLAWAMAGALSAFSAVLTAPTQGFATPESFGPSLLLRALTGAVVGRMTNLPIAFGAGVGFGIVEQLLVWNYPRAGLPDVALFCMILVALLVQKQSVGRAEDKGSWATVQALRPVPEALRQVWLIRNLGPLLGFACLGMVAALPLFISNASAVVLVTMMAFAIVGLSVGVLTGLGGQLTLGQFAIGAIGAVASYHVSSRTGSFALAIIYAGGVGAICALIVGLPALRIRGLMLTVTTLAFALAAPSWLLTQPWMFGDGLDPGRPVVLGVPLDDARRYYYFAFLLFLIAVWLARNIRRSGFGRLLVGIRDNEEGARAFTVRAAVVKAQGYMIAGSIAGLGGAAFAHSLSRVGALAFPVQASIDAVTLTVIGGVSTLIGPIVGVAFGMGVPGFVPLDSAGLAATKLGALLLILFLPGGLVHLLDIVRGRLVNTIATRKGIDVKAAYESIGNVEPEDGSPLVAYGGHRVAPSLVVSPFASEGSPLPSGRPSRSALLEARDLHKAFGGVKAIDGVSFAVNAGETVGLIGPNGAGKTTTFEVLSGFTRPDTGDVYFRGRDISSLGPEARGKRGLIRSFQDAALFPTLTVTEAVMIGLERVEPTHFLSSLVGFTAAEQAKRDQARELVAFMGLDRYRDKPIRELSTGTRRICEIACLIALRPTLLLLDEPSSGIAQRESEALAQLLKDLKDQLHLTLVIIEHDIPLITQISGRIIAMADGKVIADAAPDVVMLNPQVAHAYLGGSIQAIERSGVPEALGGQPPRRRRGSSSTNGARTKGREGLAKKGR